MTDENKAAFLDHAKSVWPREACALLIAVDGREKLIICRNRADGEEMFILHGDDYAAAEDQGEVIALIHSHPKTPPLPGEADLVACNQSNLKWYIVATLTGEWHEMYPNGYEAPLIGRSWCHGVLDCYSLIEDYYRRELKIILPHIDRDPEWWLKGQNLYIDNLAKAGFLSLPLDSKPQKHDLILMQVKSPVINHGGIYLGDEWFLHHIGRQLSRRDRLGGFWLKHTVKIARHEVFLDAENQAIWRARTEVRA